MALAPWLWPCGQSSFEHPVVQVQAFSSHFSPFLPVVDLSSVQQHVCLLACNIHLLQMVGKESCWSVGVAGAVLEETACKVRTELAVSSWHTLGVTG